MIYISKYSQVVTRGQVIGLGTGRTRIKGTCKRDCCYYLKCCQIQDLSLAWKKSYLVPPASVLADTRKLALNPICLSMEVLGNVTDPLASNHKSPPHSPLPPENVRSGNQPLLSLKRAPRSYWPQNTACLPPTPLAHTPGHGQPRQTRKVAPTLPPHAPASQWQVAGAGLVPPLDLGVLP